MPKARTASNELILRIVTTLILSIGVVSEGHADCPAPMDHPDWPASTEKVERIELKFDAAHQYGEGPPMDLLLTPGVIGVDKLTTDDISMSPERWEYLGGIPKPHFIEFFWGGPIYMDEPRNDWGKPINLDNRFGFLDAWSPLLGLHAINFFGKPNQTDIFGTPKLLSSGYFGNMSRREIEGDPTGLSCDEKTFEVTAPGDPVHYNINTKGARIVKDGWDITWHWLPHSFFFLTCGATQFAYGHGTYKGKPIETMGAFDRYGVAVDSALYLLDKRLLNPFAARGVDGKFEYGMVFIFKNAVWNGNSKFIAGGIYCKDGEGCTVTNELKLRNMTWKQSSKPPYAIIPVEGTYIVGDKEIYMKAEEGCSLIGVAAEQTKTLADLLAPAISVATVPLQWVDIFGKWREKNSPKFNLSFSGIETTEFSWQDVEEIEAAIGIPDVPGGGGIDIPGGTGGGVEADDGGAGSTTVKGDAGGSGQTHGSGGPDGDAIRPDGGAGGGPPLVAPPKGAAGGCGGCSATPGSGLADSGILLLVALVGIARRRRPSISN